MSHKKLRDNKTCLNCGHQVEERFCTQCGQENLELHDSVFQLVLHYVQDMFSYDNRIWHTLKNLVLKPGRVAREYMDGKRRQNLDPLRFYVFASSFFFLLLFFAVGSDKWKLSGDTEKNYSKRLFHLKQEKEFRKGTADTAIINQLTSSLKDRMKNKEGGAVDTTGGDVQIDLFDTKVDTLEGENWLTKILLKQLEARQSELEKQHEGDEGEASKAILDEIFHALPQLFFLSLPFFAFFLKLLYFRRPKNSYVEHFIFSIYHYAYLFIIMILFMAAQWIDNRLGGEFIESSMSYVTLGLVLYPFYYLFVSMKRFYNDKWGKLIFRFFALLFFLLITLIILFLAIAVFTFLW